MKGRYVPKKLTTKEQEGMLDEKVLHALQQDRVYFRQNPGVLVVERYYVEGEAYPLECPKTGTTVEVHRSGRRVFKIHGKVALVIDSPEKRSSRQEQKELYWKQKQARTMAMPKISLDQLRAVWDKKMARAIQPLTEPAQTET